MRVRRFPARSAATSRGIGAHTDYGLLVIAAQDDVGGRYVRPPLDGERRHRNRLETESSAGMYENEEPWTYVRPVPGVFTVFPGDILQFLTGGELLSTPNTCSTAPAQTTRPSAPTTSPPYSTNKPKPTPPPATGTPRSKPAN